jgi:hypothetical protein
VHVSFAEADHADFLTIDRSERVELGLVHDLALAHGNGLTRRAAPHVLTQNRSQEASPSVGAGVQR